MTGRQEYATHIVDLLEAFGRYGARRMFGGYDIFHQGLMFGLVADGSLYLKADDENRELFAAADSSAFSYYFTSGFPFMEIAEDVPLTLVIGLVSMVAMHYFFISG